MMNVSHGQLAVRQPEPGDQVLGLWAARFAGDIKEVTGPRRWDPDCIGEAESAMVAGGPVAMIGPDGVVVGVTRELAGRHSFENRGRGRQASKPARLVETSPRASSTFAPYLLA